ncbi:unnamed protein product [Rotaria socialis]|nr:unnamed protein product [Rotaria socialis]
MDKNILTISDSTSTVVIDKMTNLEQTVIQRWAAGANPLVQNVLEKFEIRQKERVNEINPVENLKQITLQNLPSLIEQAEHECMKHKRNRIKEERQLENRRIYYSNIHREFLELCHTVVKHTLHVDTNSSLKYDVLITKIKRIITIKTKVFDDLIQLNPTIDNGKHRHDLKENT